MFRTPVFNIPIDDVEDGPSRRRFAFLLRQMLTGKLTRDNLPPLDDLRGFAEPAEMLLLDYFGDDPYKVHDATLTLMRFDPALGPLLFGGGEADLMPPSLRIYRINELAALPPVAFLDAERIIQDKGTTMIAGQPGTGKSLWMQGKLQQIAAAMPVLLVAGEAQASLYDRASAQAKAVQQPIAADLFVCMQPVNLRNEAEVMALTDYALEVGARLIAFDTWANCTAGADENSVHDIMPIFANLQSLIRTVGCGILLIHHTRKDGVAYRGSSAILGALDNLYLLSEDDGYVTLKAVKTRDSGKPPHRSYRIVEFETRPHPQTGEPVRAPALLPAERVVDADEAAPQRVSGKPRKVLEALDAFDEGLTRQQLQEVTNLASTTVFNNLQALKQRGYVDEGSDAGRKVIYCLTAKGREALA